MLGVSFPPEEAARFAKMCGARETWGTNLYVFSPAFAAHMGMTVRDTEDAAEALRFLQEKRGMVIANTQGDREKDGYIGVFSNGGHYIVIAEAEGTTVKVWDPMYKEGSGRFDIPGRKGKVRLDGTDAYADMSVLAEDCKDRPFFLFEKRTTPAPAPLVGIIAQDSKTLPLSCMNAVAEAGGIPLVIAPDMPEDRLRDCAAQLKGLVVAADSPDAYAVKAIRLFREMNRPVLGTGCGMQMMIEALGGCAEAAGDCAESTFTSVRGTRFQVIAAEGSQPSNADKKWAVSVLPEEMRICATGADESVCAIERREGALFLGVSWHPEHMNDNNSKALFSALVESARV